MWNSPEEKPEPARTVVLDVAMRNGSEITVGVYDRNHFVWWAKNFDCPLADKDILGWAYLERS